MKKLLLLTLIFISNYSMAQDAGEYLNSVSELQGDIAKKYMTYVSSVAHGKSARKVDKNRRELMQTAQLSKTKASNLHAFKGDLSIRDALKNYLSIMYNVLNEDYEKIVNMEEVAEQSYDAMEAMILAENLAQKKSSEAFQKYDEVYNSFAKKNNINIIENNSKFSMKLELSNKVNAYSQQLYLTFFKPFKQELYMIDAQNKRNISGIEQNKNTLEKDAKKALAILDTTKNYNDDSSLKTAAKNLMNFYLEEVSKSKIVTDYYLKSDSFEKLAKVFNAKSAKARTQQDVDNYNKQVNELNTLMNEYNAQSKEINKKREDLLEKWNKANSKFLDTHMPKY